MPPLPARSGAIVIRRKPASAHPVAPAANACRGRSGSRYERPRCDMAFHAPSADFGGLAAFVAERSLSCDARRGECRTFIGRQGCGGVFGIRFASQAPASWKLAVLPRPSNEWSRSAFRSHAKERSHGRRRTKVFASIRPVPRTDRSSRGLDPRRLVGARASRSSHFSRLPTTAALGVPAATRRTDGRIGRQDPALAFVSSVNYVRSLTSHR